MNPTEFAPATLLAREPLPGGFALLRFQAPALAAAARPGHQVEIQPSAHETLFILRADAEAGWVELLWPEVEHPAAPRAGDRLPLRGPLGSALVLHPEHPRPLLLGHGAGIAPLIFLSSELRTWASFKPLALLSADAAFPFAPRPSRFIVPGMPPGVIAAPPLLDDWGIPARLASAHGAPGCHDGGLIELARLWLQTLAPAQRDEVEVFACGPQGLTNAAQALALSLRLPCQCAPG